MSTGVLKLIGDRDVHVTTGIGVPPRPERLGGEYGTLTGTETDARTRPTRAKGGLGRGLHPERWGRVAFVWPEKPFRAVSDVYPVTYFPTKLNYGFG